MSMNMRVMSGVRVSVTEDQGTKVLAFDQPVRTISLEPQEAARIGASLYRDKRAKLFSALVNLVESGFLDEPKSFAEIRLSLQHDLPNLRSSSVVMSLATLCRKGVIERSGKRRNYRYVKT